MKRKRRKKRQLKKITGLTWLQKLSIESAIEFAIDRSKQEECWLDGEQLPPISRAFVKVLAQFRKKTKSMKPPRRRRKRRVKKRKETL